MSITKELQGSQISEALLGAAERRSPVTVTWCCNVIKTWTISHGRLMGVDSHGILIQLPAVNDKLRTHAFQPADRVGVTFKLKRYTHVLSSVITEIPPALEASSEQPPTVLLVIHRPTKMRRFLRCHVTYFESSPARIFRAAFWPAGRKAEPVAIGQDTPVWSGAVTNITASGLTMRVYPMVLHFLKAGDLVGLRVVAGPGDVVAYADALFDHGDDRGEYAQICLQFIDLAETPEGQRLLRVITGSPEAGTDDAVKERGSTLTPAAPAGTSRKTKTRAVRRIPD